MSRSSVFALGFCTLLLQSSASFGGEPQVRQINTAQWQQAFEEAASTPGAVLQKSPGQVLVLINRPDRQEAFFFSTPELPAHPAAISVIFSVDSGGTMTKEVNGRYAGPKEAFDLWLKGVLARVSGEGR